MAPLTWPVIAWSEILLQLFAIYDLAPANDPLASEIQVQIQNDWDIFKHKDQATIRTFLSGALSASHPFLINGNRVRLRYQQSGPNADHTATWSAFSAEIRLRNRYFPQTEPDRDLLEQALTGNVTRIQEGKEFFRARRSQNGGAHNADEMGAPPLDKATPGRANPVGIPYLYLSFEEDTCIYETRVANHTQISIGTFQTIRDLSVLDLVNITRPDFLYADNPIASISIFKYLQRLGDELKKPVRSSDQPIDYIPTQYLCEMAKSLGLDGVMYGSSLHPGGWNLVLFDVHSARCLAVIKQVDITSLTAEWDIIN